MYTVYANAFLVYHNIMHFGFIFSIWLWSDDTKYSWIPYIHRMLGNSNANITNHRCVVMFCHLVDPDLWKAWFSFHPFHRTACYVYKDVNASRHWGHIRSLAHYTASLSSLCKSVLNNWKVKRLWGIIWRGCVKPSLHGQNDRNFADNIFRCKF